MGYAADALGLRGLGGRWTNGSACISFSRTFDGLDLVMSVFFFSFAGAAPCWAESSWPLSGVR